MEELSRPAPVDALNPQTTTEKRMPAVMDHDKLPDMGRMNGRWVSGEKTGCSPDRTPAARP